MEHKIKKISTLASLAICLALAISVLPSQPAAMADPAIPPTSNILTDNFESGNLDAWEIVSAQDVSLIAGSGVNDSTALSIAVNQDRSNLYQSGVALAEEAYLTFWFNPNNVNIPDKDDTRIPSKSLRVAAVKGSALWHTLVSLRVHRPAGQSYKAYLEWHAEDDTQYDYASGEFDLAEGWQKITLGFRVDEWVAVWLNDVLVRRVTGITHEEALGEIVEVGKTNTNSSITPAGTLRYDDVTFQIPRITDLWVNAINGNDANDGLTAATPFRTIQKAADLAGNGTTVHILPGVYRETVRLAMDGSAAGPARYIAENGPGTVAVRGSDPASSLTWSQLTANTIGLPPGVDPTSIYYADLSAWGLDSPPRFVAELDGSGEVVARLPLAHEPDWSVVTEWKYHEFWWAADGGSDAAGCDPTTDPDPQDCDSPWRSTTRLTDRTNDTDPPGVEPGNLTTLGDLTGATVVALDTVQGHYVYRRTIVAHDTTAGRITVDRICEHDSGSGTPGLGWGSKYYIEGKPYLLDTPGEWWYDQGSGRLYLWPRTAGNPATMNIEISRQYHGFDLSERSYVTLDGLTIELFNENAVYQKNGDDEKSYDNTVRNTTLRYANRGIFLSQSASGSSSNVTDGFTLENSEVAYMDTSAIYSDYWWENESDIDDFTHSGIVNTVIQGNELHHLGFRAKGDNAIGGSFQQADKLRFEGNHLHHVAHNGIQFSKSVIQSSKDYGFSPHEIKSGEILIKDNIFEKACQLTTDCGALKFWGRSPDAHVFRDVLITGNIFRNTFGWTHVSEKRERWTSGTVQGMGGFGLYVDNASGIHAYRNIAYNNAHVGFKMSGVWRDGDMVYYNNIAANSLYGFKLGGSSYDTHGSVNTLVSNNILLNNEGYGILMSDGDGIYTNIAIDHNLYYGNGWGDGAWKPGAMSIQPGSTSTEYYQTLAEIQAHTPWEDHGQTGDPAFVTYALADHDRQDGSWPDFHLTGASANAIDKGTDDLPVSLAALLDRFGVQDPHWQAYDIGCYEVNYAIKAAPKAGVTQPGVASYTLSTVPADAGLTFSLSLSPPPPGIQVELSSEAIPPGGTATLTMTSHESEPKLPGEWQTVTVTATGGSFTRTTELDLLVGGYRFYMPLLMKGW